MLLHFNEPASPRSSVWQAQVWLNANLLQVTLLITSVACEERLGKTFETILNQTVLHL